MLPIFLIETLTLVVSFIVPTCCATYYLVCANQEAEKEAGRGGRPQSGERVDKAKTERIESEQRRWLFCLMMCQVALMIAEMLEPVLATFEGLIGISFFNELKFVFLFSLVSPKTGLYERLDYFVDKLYSDFLVERVPKCFNRFLRQPLKQKLAQHQE